MRVKLLPCLLGQCVGCFLLAHTFAAAQNLVQNPGFEDQGAGGPLAWHLYVEPQPGSKGAPDDTTAHEGRWSVMLHNASAYAVEPANNWSQNILQPLARKTLHVSGSIKTEDATHAALWVQCFRKQPWTVLLQQSTSDVKPLSGTRDWTSVEMDVAVPGETDFVVLRCVLKGTGKAWFDDAQVAVKEELKTDTPVAERPVEVPKGPILPVTPSSPAISGQSPVGASPSRDEIMAAQGALREANEALRQSNQALADQLNAMRQQLQDLREQIRSVEAAGKAEIEEAKSKPPAQPVPPLMPRLPEKRQETP